MAKLIVIEGTDGSGKQTQSKKLYDYLISLGKKAILLSFPDYESNDLNMLKNMLQGQYGNNILDINIYPICSMYALDRWNSYQKYWKENYLSDDTYIICDRYVESMLFYASNRYNYLEDKKYIIKYILDLEYIKFKLPIPDIIIYLNRDFNNVKNSIDNRDDYIKTGNKNKDIIEKNNDFIKTINSNLQYIIDESLKFSPKIKWEVVNYGIAEKSIDEIHEIIKQKVIYE